MKKILIVGNSVRSKRLLEILKVFPDVEIIVQNDKQKVADIKGITSPLCLLDELHPPGNLRSSPSLLKYHEVENWQLKRRTPWRKRQ